jgi:hypothetical protein
VVERVMRVPVELRICPRIWIVSNPRRSRCGCGDRRGC